MTNATNISQDKSTCTYTGCYTEGLTRDASINGDTKNRKPLHLSEPFEQWELDEMEQTLGDLCGHLGLFLCFNWNVQ